VPEGAAGLCDAIVGEFPQLRCQAIADNAIRVEASEPVRVGPLVQLLENHGTEVSEAQKIRPSLEEVFVRITGIEATAMKLEKEKAKIGASR
jgi:ABC-2 type transport system ATP-binding protein